MAMGQMISPGVYTTIIDLSQYLADVPGTVGFIPVLTKSGPDNKLMFVSSNEQYLSTYGKPNITDYGTVYGQGPYVATQHLSVSSHLYVLRALPDDAVYSHLFIGMQLADYILNGTYSSSSEGIPFTRLEMHPMYMDGKQHSFNGAFTYTADGTGVVTAASVQNTGYGYAPGIWTFLVPLADGSTPDTCAQLNYTVDETGPSAGKITAVTIHKPGNGYVPGTRTVAIKNLIWRTIAHTIEAETQLKEEITTPWMNLPATGGTGVPYGFLMYFRGVGRGAYYNSFAVRISANANKQLFGTYILDIYGVNPSTGDQIIMESYNVSFDPTAVDGQGESAFIEDVVNRFSPNIRCSVSKQALHTLYEDDGSGESYMMSFYKNDPTLPSWVTEYTVLDENGQKTELGFKAIVIEFAKGDYDYANWNLNVALDALAVARLMPTDTQQHIIDRNTAVSAALVDLSVARTELDKATAALDEAYNLDIMDFGDSDPSLPGIQPWSLLQGSEGSLVYLDKTSGKEKIHPQTATQVLVEAYQGLLKKPDNPAKEDPATGNLIWKEQYCDEMLDLDWIYFSLVWDAGYDVNVKTAARELAEIYRLDCMCISDCGDNSDLEDCLQQIGEDPNRPDLGVIWNTKFAARFESYSRVYDVYTGKDIWFTPVYHMAQLIPLNDRLYEIWYASAGFNRGTLESIKELRWSPKLGERNILYLNQVNPIVHFPEGYTVWGNLTTQKRPSSLQDINIMRLVLYIKRALEQFCRYFIFEFNDAVTWEQIKIGIVPFLDAIKAKRGLISYSIDVGATEWEFQNKICHVNVTLEPMKVIEKIALNLYIK